MIIPPVELKRAKESEPIGLFAGSRYQTIPKKIAFIADEIVCHTAGTEGQLLSIMEKLLSFQYEVHLILLRPSAFTDTLSANIATCTLNLEKIFSLNAISAGRRLYRYLRKNNIRLVHTFFNDASIIAPLICKMAGAKVVIARRDLGFWYNQKILFFCKIIRRFVDCVVANSNAVKRAVCYHEGYDTDKVSIIYNGHDLKKFNQSTNGNLKKQFSIPEKAPIVGMVANFHEYKRHVDLINALSMIHKERPDTHLVFIGGGRGQSRLQKSVSMHDKKDFVHFAGIMSNPIPAIKEFAIGVLCSSTEGFSNVLIEYMGCGKAVIASAVGGNLEILEDGRNGFLFPVGDTKTLAKRIVMLLNDNSLRKKVSKAAKKNVFRIYDINKVIQQYQLLYDDLLS